MNERRRPRCIVFSSFDDRKLYDLGLVEQQSVVKKGMENRHGEGESVQFAASLKTLLDSTIACFF